MKIDFNDPEEKAVLASTDCTLAELAGMAKFDKSLSAGEYPRYLVSRFRSPERTAAQCVALAEEYAAAVIARRDSDDPSPDDPVTLQRIAERDSEALAERVYAETENREKADAQRKTSLDHRERKMLERPIRRIEQHLAMHPEPKRDK